MNNLFRILENVADGGVCSRRRANRTAFTTDQLKILKKEFSCDPYVSVTKRQKIAEMLNLNEDRVKVSLSC